MKILIVDDEPLVRKSLGRACSARGHQVIEASDGIEGLAKWRESRPDLIFLDVLMPGLSGPELLREIRLAEATRAAESAEGKAAKVILMSAYAGEYNVATSPATADRPSADLFIPKPFEDVFEVVARAEALKKQW